MSGYEWMVSADIFRGPLPREPGGPARPDAQRRCSPTPCPLPHVNHTFRPGHRIMVQVQSTLVPPLRPEPADVRAVDHDGAARGVPLAAAQRPPRRGERHLPRAAGRRRRALSCVALWMSAPITVVGSLNMDFVVQVVALPRPGETVLGGGFATIPGGKGANQACAAAKLGGRVRMVGRVGDDALGRALRESLAAAGADTTAVLATEGTADRGRAHLGRCRGAEPDRRGAGRERRVDCERRRSRARRRRLRPPAAAARVAARDDRGGRGARPGARPHRAAGSGAGTAAPARPPGGRLVPHAERERGDDAARAEGRHPHAGGGARRRRARSARAGREP